MTTPSLFGNMTTTPDEPQTGASTSTFPKKTRGSRGTVTETAATETKLKPKSNNFARNDDFFFGVPRQSPPHALCPPAEQCHEFTFNENLAPALRELMIGKNIFLIGAPGSGKTLMARWIANQLGWALYFQSHNAHTQADELGVQAVQGADGKWTRALGIVLSAYKHGGIVCLDELAAVKDAGVGKFYYPILNRDPITVLTDNGLEVIYPHPEFRVIATGNHWNTTSGNYELGEALADRFIFIECDFLPPEQEIALLIKDAPSVPRGSIKDLVTFANRTRAKAKNADTKSYVLSTRGIRNLVRGMEEAGNTLAEVVEMHIFSTLRIKYPEEYETTKATLEDIVTLA